MESREPTVFHSLSLSLVLSWNPSKGPSSIPSADHLDTPNYLYLSFPTLVPIMAPLDMPARDHSDTTSDEASLEPGSSPIFEESDSIITSGVSTRDSSDTPIYITPLELFSSQIL